MGRKEVLRSVQEQLDAYSDDSDDTEERDIPLALDLANRNSTTTTTTTTAANSMQDNTGNNAEPCDNFARLVEVILEEKSVYMVFEYAEHDLLVRSAHALLGLLDISQGVG